MKTFQQYYLVILWFVMAVSGFWLFFLMPQQDPLVLRVVGYVITLGWVIDFIDGVSNGGLTKQIDNLELACKSLIHMRLSRKAI